MIDVTPISPSGQGQQFTLTVGNRQIVLEIPLGLENQPPGALIKATVARVETGRQAVLDIFSDPAKGLASGKLLIDSKLPLAPGNQLSLRVVANTLTSLLGEAGAARGGIPPAFEARILSINGKPAPGAEEQATQVSLSPQASKSLPAALPGTPPDTLNLVRAVFPRAFSSPAEESALPIRQNPGEQEVVVSRQSPRQQRAGALLEQDVSIRQPLGARIQSIVVAPNAPLLQQLPQSLAGSPSGAAPPPLAGDEATVQSLLPALRALRGTDTISFRIQNIQLPPTAPEASSLTTAKSAPLQPASEGVAAPAAGRNPPPPVQGAGAENAATPPPRGTVLPSPATPVTSVTEAASALAPPPLSPPRALPQPGQLTPQQFTQALPNVTALVIGAERSGEPVVQTALGTLKLPADIAFPKGTLLQLRLEQVGTTSAATPAAPVFQSEAAEQSLRQLSLPGNVLEEAAHTLARIDAQLGTQYAHQRFPGAGAQTAARLLWFLGGVQQASPEVWLGKEAYARVRQHSPELIPRLEQTFQSLRILSSDVNPQGWQTQLLPFYDGKDVHLARLYLHKERQQKQKRGREAAAQGDIRFIVEVELTHTGPLQLDGFVKQATGEPARHASRALNLRVRTHSPLPDGLQRGIREVFANTSAATGMQGQIEFSVTREFPVNPARPEESKPHGEDFFA